MPLDQYLCSRCGVTVEHHAHNKLLPSIMRKLSHGPCMVLPVETLSYNYPSNNLGRFLYQPCSRWPIRRPRPRGPPHGMVAGVDCEKPDKGKRKEGFPQAWHHTSRHPCSMFAPCFILNIVSSYARCGSRWTEILYHKSHSAVALPRLSLAPRGLNKTCFT